MDRPDLPIRGSVAAAEQQWRRRPVAALLITVAVKLGPVALSFAAGIVAGRVIGRPAQWPAIGAWLAGVLAISTVVLVATDRILRRALPLAALLRMSLLVPDRTPSRLRIAMGAKGEPGPGGDAARLLALVASLDGHDRRAQGHSARVRAYVDLIAAELRLGARDRELLRWAALLHDVGKLRVPSGTLQRSGRLREMDWLEVRRHPVEGARLVAPLRGFLGPWASAVVQHHERWDGGGYPGGLAGLQISLGARIVAVADAFETMTATGTGQKPFTPAQAREELTRCAGSQFDPMVVRAFLAVSVPKLRWILGPLTWAAEQPFLGGAARVAVKAGSVGTRIGVGAATAGAVAGGAIVATPPPTAGPPAPSTTVAVEQRTDERGVIDVFSNQSPAEVPPTTGAP